MYQSRVFQNSKPTQPCGGSQPKSRQRQCLPFKAVGTGIYSIKMVAIIGIEHFRVRTLSRACYVHGTAPSKSPITVGCSVGTSLHYSRRSVLGATINRTIEFVDFSHKIIV